MLNQKIGLVKLIYPLMALATILDLLSDELKRELSLFQKYAQTVFFESTQLGQILLGISFNLQDTFEEYLTSSHRTFLAMLRVIEEHQPAVERIYKGRGRIPHEGAPMIRAFFAKSFFNSDTTAGLLERLKSDSSLPLCVKIDVVSCKAHILP